MLVVKPVSSISDPTRPGYILARDGLGIIQTYKDRSRLDALQRLAVHWRSCQQGSSCLKTNLEHRMDKDITTTHFRPDVAIFARQRTDRDALVISSQRDHALDLTVSK